MTYIHFKIKMAPTPPPIPVPQPVPYPAPVPMPKPDDMNIGDSICYLLSLPLTILPTTHSL